MRQPLRGRNAGVRSDETAGPRREAPRAEPQSRALGNRGREPYSPWPPRCWELPRALCARSAGECGLRTRLGVPGERAGDSVPAGPGLACAPTSVARVQRYLRNKPLISSFPVDENPKTLSNRNHAQVLSGLMGDFEKPPTLTLLSHLGVTSSTASQVLRAL